jgi:monoamine oxidase
MRRHRLLVLAAPVLLITCHFAGEHCSQSFQGFMEGGAEEGARAANEILSDYKAGIFP